MKTSNALLSRRSVPALLALAVLLPASGPVRAEQFPLFGGQVLGLTKTTIAWGAAFRNANAQGQLVGAGAGQGDNPEFPGASGAVGVRAAMAAMSASVICCVPPPHAITLAGIGRGPSSSICSLPPPQAMASAAAWPFFLRL